MDTISKVTANYFMELTELHTVKILLCYLLEKLNKPITEEQLYEIAVSDEIINYFLFSEAMEELIKNETIIKKDGVLVLTNKGISCAKQFHQYVPKSFRDKLHKGALQYFARLKRENEVVCDVLPAEKGRYVRCRILDPQGDLMDLRLFAPDDEQAQLICEKIMLNPSAFYGKIINFALDNVEDEPELD